jgi:hypothetical protein
MNCFKAFHNVCYFHTFNSTIKCMKFYISFNSNPQFYFGSSAITVQGKHHTTPHYFYIDIENFNQCCKFLSCT